MAVQKPKYPPPTKEQVQKIHLYLGKGCLPETAMARCGIPKVQYNEWLRHGNAGTPGYTEFVESLDSALIDFQCQLLSIISEAALDKANVSAAQWLYMQRFGFKEKKAQEAEEKAAQAEAVFSLQKQKEVDAAEADAAEARLMGLQ